MNFRNTLQKWMMGRYGNDSLNKMLFVILIFFLLLQIVFHNVILQLFVLLLIFLIYYRMLSRNITKRAQENQYYLQKANSLKNGVKSKGIYTTHEKTIIFLPVHSASRKFVFQKEKEK